MEHNYLQSRWLALWYIFEQKDYLSISYRITISKKDCPTTPQKREHMSRIPYASIVGSIVYAMIYTRSDVAYSLGVVSRYQSDPNENHWKVTKTILKYLKNTKDQWLVYRKSDLKLMRYTDSSFQSDHDDNKSMLDTYLSKIMKRCTEKIPSRIL